MRNVSIQKYFGYLRHSIGTNDFAGILLFWGKPGDRMHNSQKIKRDLNTVDRVSPLSHILAPIIYVFLFLCDYFGNMRSR